MAYFGALVELNKWGHCIDSSRGRDDLSWCYYHTTHRKMMWLLGHNKNPKW